MPHKAQTSKPNAWAFGINQLWTYRCLAIAVALAFSTTIPALASGPTLTVNGASASATEAVHNNVVFVPAQSVFSKLGEVVIVRAPLVFVRETNGLELARLTLGSRQATLKGAAQTLAAAPFAAHRALMVPLRFVSQAAGATVAYSTSPRSIHIRKSMEPTAGGAIAAAAPAAVVAQVNAAPQATDAAVAPAAATQADLGGGVPWWVWLLAALVVLALMLAFMRRKKEPLITTRRNARSGEPTITTRK